MQWMMVNIVNIMMYEMNHLIYKMQFSLILQTPTTYMYGTHLKYDIQHMVTIDIRTTQHKGCMVHTEMQSVVTGDEPCHDDTLTSNSLTICNT